MPYKLAEEFGIDAIYWLDSHFKEYFEKPKIEKKPDLELLLIKDSKAVASINLEMKEPPVSTIEDEEFKSVYEESNSQHFSILARLKSREELESELEKYNLEMKNFFRFYKIEMVLYNNGFLQLVLQIVIFLRQYILKFCLVQIQYINVESMLSSYHIQKEDTMEE